MQCIVTARPTEHKHGSSRLEPILAQNTSVFCFISFTWNRMLPEISQGNTGLHMFWHNREKTGMNKMSGCYAQLTHMATPTPLLLFLSVGTNANILRMCVRFFLSSHSGKRWGARIWFLCSVKRSPMALQTGSWTGRAQYEHILYYQFLKDKGVSMDV